MMDMLELKKFEKGHIDEYISFAYDSFQFNNRLFQGPEAEGRESFNAGSRAVIQKFIEAAEEVNRFNKTNILYNSYIEKEGKMVSALFFCDATYFIEVLQKQLKVRQSQKFSKEILAKGTKGVIGRRHCVRKEYVGIRLYTRHMLMAKDIFMGVGYRYGYFNFYNQYSLRTGVRLGGEELRREEVRKNLWKVTMRTDFSRAVEEKPKL